MIYKQVKNSIEKLGGRFYIVELLVILLLCTYVVGNFGSFSVYWGSKTGYHLQCMLCKIVWFTEIDRLGLKKTFEMLRGPTIDGINVSFLRNNLVIGWDYYGYLSTSGKKKAVWPDGHLVSGPVFLSPTEKKPYYLFNLDINYYVYPLRFFRNFTKGDGSQKFAENHKEIKALVFYKKDSAKVMKIKRKIERIVWEKKSGKGKTLGILFFED